MEESKSLLAVEEEIADEFDLSKSTGGQTARGKLAPLYQKLKRIYFFCLHFILFILFVHLLRPSSAQTKSEDSLYTPMANPMNYVVKTERQHEKMMRSAYTGWPTEENNHAWEDLISPLLFNATAEEMALAGEPLEDSVRVASGGYLASLGVYHELHCLRRLRLWLHRDTYYPNATRDDELFMQVHLGHCIEVLRLSAMCTADLGLYSFFWSRPDATKPQARSSAPRKCLEWSKIDEWSRERMITNTHIPLLKTDQK